MSGLKKVVIFSVLLAIVIFIVVFLRVAYLINHGQCQLLDEEPISSASIGPIKNHRSHNSLALVNFEGYLTMRNVDSRRKFFSIQYLPLELGKVDYLVDIEDSSFELKLDLECALVSLRIILNENGMYIVEDVIVESRSSHARFEPCHVYAFGFSTYFLEHYRCDQQRVYGCWELPYGVAGRNQSRIKAQKLVSIELVMNRFEFEINGDPNAIDGGHFSKVVATC